MAEQAIETFYPATRKQWRKWLEKNHDKKQSVWLVYYKKGSNMQTISWSEAVDEALCFGWIDSKAKPLDEEKFMQFFSRRKASSVWSKINKEKIKRLTAEGLMAKAGMDVIDRAKQNGTWTILDEVEELIIPADLDKALKGRKGAKKFFSNLCRSDKRFYLQWLVLAKRPETRQNRINSIIESSALGLKPGQSSK